MQESVEQTETSNECIGRNFGNSAKDYHEQAALQKGIAKRLIASLEPWREIIPPGPVLEVGCGTGFVTEGIIDLYPKREKIITDLSPEMLNFCRSQFSESSNLSFKTLDAETVSLEDPYYSLVVSGFTAQWFKDPALTLGKLLEATKPGGLLLASFPGSKSFPEWRSYCQELGIPYTGNTLPDTEEIVVKLSTGPVQVDFYEDTVTQQFNNAADFFRHLKVIGANTRQKGRALNASEMKLLINHWNSECEHQITVSYHAVFLAVKRDHLS